MTDAEHQESAAVVADFETLYQSHYHRVLGLATSLTGSRSAAEELAQEAWTIAYQRWNQVGTFPHPVAWVNKVVANRSINRWRSLGREAKALARFGARSKDHFEMAPVDADFWSAVSKLPGQQRQVIALHYLEDMGVGEIADLLDRSEGTVKTQLFRARQSLADALGATHSPNASFEEGK